MCNLFYKNDYINRAFVRQINKVLNSLFVIIINNGKVVRSNECIQNPSFFPCIQKNKRLKKLKYNNNNRRILYTVYTD